MDEYATRFHGMLAALNSTDAKAIERLTMIAGDMLATHGEVLTALLCTEVQSAELRRKIPLIYTIDSMCKSHRGFVPFFVNSLVFFDLYVNTYGMVSANDRFVHLTSYVA